MSSVEPFCRGLFQFYVNAIGNFYEELGLDLKWQVKIRTRVKAMPRSGTEMRDKPGKEAPSLIKQQ